MSRLSGLASLRPLRRREFALVWSAALVSNIGSWVQTVAVGVLVTSLTGQAVAVAALLVLEDQRPLQLQGRPALDNLLRHRRAAPGLHYR